MYIKLICVYLLHNNKQIETMIDYREYNPLDEMDELPPLTELEEQQEWNKELLKKNQLYKSQIADIIDKYDGVFQNNVVINQLKKIT